MINLLEELRRFVTDPSQDIGAENYLWALTDTGDSAKSGSFCCSFSLALYRHHETPSPKPLYSRERSNNGNTAHSETARNIPFESSQLPISVWTNQATSQHLEGSSVALRHLVSIPWSNSTSASTAPSHTTAPMPVPAPVVMTTTHSNSLRRLQSTMPWNQRHYQPQLAAAPPSTPNPTTVRTASTLTRAPTPTSITTLRSYTCLASVPLTTTTLPLRILLLRLTDRPRSPSINRSPTQEPWALPTPSSTLLNSPSSRPCIRHNVPRQNSSPTRCPTSSSLPEVPLTALSLCHPTPHPRSLPSNILSRPRLHLTSSRGLPAALLSFSPRTHLPRTRLTPIWRTHIRDPARLLATMAPRLTTPTRQRRQAGVPRVRTTSCRLLT